MHINRTPAPGFHAPKHPGQLSFRAIKWKYVGTANNFKSTATARTRPVFHFHMHSLRSLFPQRPTLLQASGINGRAVLYPVRLGSTGSPLYDDDGRCSKAISITHYRNACNSRARVFLLSIMQRTTMSCSYTSNSNRRRVLVVVVVVVVSEQPYQH